MKKILSVILAILMCMSFLACGASPSEKLPKEVEKYLSENYRIGMDGFVSEPVNVDIASVVEMVKNHEWAVMGTYTVKIKYDIMSAKFAILATYDESNREFEFSNVEFGDWE